MFLVMYFLLIRPQQKRQKEHDAMLKALDKGTVVRTNGGIRGEILEIDDHEVTLKIADKTKINVLRSHIAGPHRDAGRRRGTEQVANIPPLRALGLQSSRRQPL